MVKYTFGSNIIFECEENSLLDLAITEIRTKQRARQTKALTTLINQYKPIKLLPPTQSKDILTVLKKG